MRPPPPPSTNRKNYKNSYSTAKMLEFLYITLYYISNYYISSFSNSLNLNLNKFSNVGYQNNRFSILLKILILFHKIKIGCLKHSYFSIPFSSLSFSGSSSNFAFQFISQNHTFCEGCDNDRPQQHRNIHSFNAQGSCIQYVRKTFRKTNKN